MQDRHKNLSKISATPSKLMDVANAEKADVLIYLLEQAKTEAIWHIDAGNQPKQPDVANRRDRC